jgi:hypothetical protein
MLPDDLPCPSENFPKVEIHLTSFMMMLPEEAAAILDCVWDTDS